MPFILKLIMSVFISYFIMLILVVIWFTFIDNRTELPTIKMYLVIQTLSIIFTIKNHIKQK